MRIYQHGGSRAGRKCKCGGSAPRAWKPYLCLPERSGGNGLPAPVRSTSIRKKGLPIHVLPRVYRCCCPVLRDDGVDCLAPSALRCSVACAMAGRVLRCDAVSASLWCEAMFLHYKDLRVTLLPGLGRFNRVACDDLGAPDRRYVDLRVKRAAKGIVTRRAETGWCVRLVAAMTGWLCKRRVSSRFGHRETVPFWFRSEAGAAGV